MRIYYDRFLSVTSIIELKEPFDNKAFLKWCSVAGKDAKLISSTSRILGEKVASYLDNISHDLEWLTAPQVDSLEDNLRLACDDFLQEWELLGTEVEVVCEELNYAGRFDGMVRNRTTGETLLVDWKTFGAWKDKTYKRDKKKIVHTTWQLSLYAYALNWKQGLAVVVFKNDGTYEIERVDFDNEMIEWVREHQSEILKVIKENK